MSEADHYAILGVGPEAEPDAIHQAYRRAIDQVRRTGKGRDTQRMRLVEEARAVLLDPVARAAYDARCVGHDLIAETAAAIISRFESRR